MRYLYGLTDEKFVKVDFSDKTEKTGPLDTYQFRVHNFLKGKTAFNRNVVPSVFKASPDTLLNLCSQIVDAFPLPPVYTWTNGDVCVWLREYGYPQYRETFIENMINGRTLLLLDASALSAMNIKNFDHIKHISQGIRGLFFFELTKFSRSISLAPHFHYELYKLYRVKSGRKFEQVRRTDLWRMMQLIRENPPVLSHWEILEKWLSLKRDPIFQELFGGFHRHKLYSCKIKKEPKSPQVAHPVRCRCIPPCECYWTEDQLRRPWRLKVLGPKAEPPYKECTKCVPPCTCGWKSKWYNDGTVISCLLDTFPQKYQHRAQNMNIKFRNSGLKNFRASIFVR